MTDELGSIKLGRFILHLKSCSNWSVFTSGLGNAVVLIIYRIRYCACVPGLTTVICCRYLESHSWKIHSVGPIVF